MGRFMYFYDTDIGILTISEKSGAIDGVNFGKVEMPGYELAETTLIKKCIGQIREYLSGQRKEFDIPLLMEGTEFQKSVWDALLKIPYGETRSYGEVASMIGRPKASRAVGGANHNNPVAIIVP